MARFPKAVEDHFERYPFERSAVERFTDLFEIGYSDHVKVDRSDFSFYLLKPKKHASEIYGFERELLLLYSPYTSLEPRTIQQTDTILSRPRLQGRTEPLYLLLVAPIPDIETEIGQYRQEAEQGRIIVGFSEQELQEDRDPWLLRKRFAKTLFSRDLFDMKQALVNDTYFFGRQALVLDLLDRLKRGENSGVYGLRKTGKTSAIFKLRRLMATERAGIFVYIDAQNPGVAQLRWWELLSQIRDQAAAEAEVTLPHPLDRPFTERTATTRMQQALAFIMDKTRVTTGRVLVVVDEVEHICPGLTSTSHWEEDFLPFWKLLRAIQTQERRLALLIAGVNAQVSEIPSIGAQDNPLFSLVGVRYLPLFTPHETRDMVQRLGARMGLIFAPEACAYLARQYGGHPMLVRLACSWEHQLRAADDLLQRPVQITAEQLESTEQEREKDLLHYARHVLDVLRQWYPQEYELLSFLAVDDVATFDEFAREMPETVQHLKAYGLLTPRHNTLAIGMLKTYLATELRKASRREASGDRNAAGPVISNLVSLPPEATKLDLEQLIRNGENARTEFKSTLRMNLHTSRPDPSIEHAVLKTIAAFLNTEGGHLIVGVADHGRALGIENDAFPNEDKMTLHLVNLIKDRLGAEHAAVIRANHADFEGRRVLVVECLPAQKPVYLRDVSGEKFFVRLLAATAELSIRQAGDYIASRFKT